VTCAESRVATSGLWVLKNDPDAAACLAQGRHGNNGACKGLRWLSAN